MADGKWQMAKAEAVVPGTELDVVTTRFEAQGG
jgi:hypothetical protein